MCLLICILSTSLLFAAITVTTGNDKVWKLTGTTAADQVILPATSTVKIHSIYWYAPTTATHIFELNDGNDTSLGIKLQCVTALEGIIIYPGGLVVDGLTVVDMDSGEVYITFSDE